MSFLSVKSGISAVIRLNSSKSNVLSFCFKRWMKAQSVNFAEKKGGPVSTRKGLDFERDPYKLCTQLVGGNFMKDGEDPVLGADEDYPAWLWDLKISKEPVRLGDLSEDDPKYWYLLKNMTLKQQMKMKKNKKF